MINPLEIINLSKAYNAKQAVKNISFKLAQNEIIGILGPNGCGKTTTIGMILGLLKPTNGKVLINGIEVENQRVDLLNELNFISPYIELPKKLTVKQNLEVYGRLYDVKKLKNISEMYKIKPQSIAYIGDDVNDLPIMKLIGFSATPNDGILEAKKICDYTCKSIGGNGAFREIVDLIIRSQKLSPR